MFSATELTQMRTDLTASLPDVCTITRLTQTSDGAGGYNDAWLVVATTVCSIAPTGNQPEERAIAARLGNTVSYTITVPWNTSVTAKDLIVSGGRTFDVAGVLIRSQPICLRCVVTERL